jgi:CheY-like chemotaxis protein
MKILLVEDDEYKIDLIVPFIKSMILDVDLTFAASVKSAKKELDNDNEIHVVLLDMTLPTFDMTAGSSGGRPQGFGGLEVLRVNVI